MPKQKWMSEAFSGHQKGALHRQLGIPQGQRIPTKKLVAIKNTEIGKYAVGRTVTPLLKKRAVLALTARKAKK